MPVRIKVNIPVPDGSTIEVEHALPGPWKVEEFSTGACAILNASGQNWINFPDQPGAVLVGRKFADAIVKALNETGK